MAIVLVVAPHPDDEILGCGGTIARHVSQGDTVYVCIVTTAYTPDWSKEYIEHRHTEITNSNSILGIKKTFFLDFPTAKFDTISRKEINESLHSVVQRLKPEVVYIPHGGDIHLDHRIVHESALVALRPSSNSSTIRTLAYETLSETEWGRSLKHFIPNVFVDITDFLELKKNAMKAYGSELRQEPNPRSLNSIEALARKRGSEVNVSCAESFMLLREILP